MCTYCCLLEIISFLLTRTMLSLFGMSSLKVGLLFLLGLHCFQQNQGYLNNVCNMFCQSHCRHIPADFIRQSIIWSLCFDAPEHLPEQNPVWKQSRESSVMEHQIKVCTSNEFWMQLVILVLCLSTTFLKIKRRNCVTMRIFFLFCL